MQNKKKKSTKIKKVKIVSFAFGDKYSTNKSFCATIHTKFCKIILKYSNYRISGDTEDIEIIKSALSAASSDKCSVYRSSPLRTTLDLVCYNAQFCKK